jgi:hypothetical protein
MNIQKPNDQFAAMRRAAGLNPLPAPPVFIKPRLAAEILYRGIKLSERPDSVLAWNLCQETVSWRTQRNGAMRVHWFAVTQYAPGFIRLRNDLIAPISKKVWPFNIPEVPRFKLTFHWREISEDLGIKVFEFCNAVSADEFKCNWDLFKDEETYPGYAWTRRAKLAYPKAD